MFASRSFHSIFCLILIVRNCCFFTSSATRFGYLYKPYLYLWFSWTPIGISISLFKVSLLPFLIFSRKKLTVWKVNDYLAKKKKKWMIKVNSICNVCFGNWNPTIDVERGWDPGYHLWNFCLNLNMNLVYNLMSIDRNDLSIWLATELGSLLGLFVNKF